MTTRLLLLWLAATSLLLITSCGQETPDKPYRAKIVAFTPDGYRLKTVQFQTLEDIDTLKGPIGRFIGNAALDGNSEIEEIIDPRKKDSIYIDRGQNVRLDYKVRGGTVYPRNYDTMALLSLYYHYEKTVLYWTQEMDLPFDDFGALRIFYAPRIKATGKEGSIDSTVKVNAAFLPGPRDLFFFQTSGVEQIPITMNLGVIAHEFSHAIFDFRFADKNASLYLAGTEDTQDQLRGINEGIADFYAYLVTRRPEDLGESLPVLAAERTLPVGWTYSSLADADCHGGFYCKGSILASALYELSQHAELSPNLVGKMVYDALPQFRKNWQEHADDPDFNYHFLIKEIIEVADPSLHSILCSRFQHWFDVATVADNIGC